MANLHALDGIRVLLVDDDADARDMYRFALEHDGASVQVAGSAAAAFAIAVDWLPQVVITDFLLSDGPTGADLCARLRAHSRTAHIPALVMTGSTRKGDAEKVLGAGCADLRIKPYLPDDMLADVHRLATARSAHVRTA
jgi:two-component system phosphate regulon response regulator PhoB